MKNLRIYVLTLVLVSCNFYDKVSPNVETYTLSDNKSTNAYEWERVAPKVLYQFYSTSGKDKEFYEVVENKFGHVFNYSPKRQLLTIATEISSGWQSQYKDVTEAKLQELMKANVLFNKYDSLLTRSDPMDFETILSNHNTKLVD
jgi:hypothetical protein